MRSVLVVLATLAVIGVRMAAAQPSNDACSAAVVIPSVPYTQTRSISGATGAFDDPTYECQFDEYAGDEGSIWYRYTAPQAISLQVDTFGSTIDTVVAVHDGACGLFTDVVACNNDDHDIYVSTEQSRTIATLAAGQTAYIQVLDRGGEGGTVTLNVSASPIVQVSRLKDEGHHPSVAAIPGGGFMVVWRSDDPDGDDQHVFGRRLAPTGLPAGPRFTVSEQPTSYPMPAVAAGGSTVVAIWDEGDEILARRFDLTGTPLGSEFTVAGDEVGYYPGVAADPLGNFLVVWSNDDGSGSGIAAQPYDALGVPQGGPIQVNTYTTNDQARPSVSADGAGNFVVAWNSTGQDGDGYGVFAQRLDASGMPLGSEIPVNDGTDGDQRYPSVSAHATGSFLVAWWDDSDCFFCVDTRGFDATGAPVGPSVRIDDDDTGWPPGRPIATSVDAAGTFTVAWSDDYRIVSRQVDGAGEPLGALFQVSHLRSGYLYHPGVASAPGGEFVVAWEWSPYGSHYDVMSRLVNPAVDVGDPCPARPREDCRLPFVGGKSQLVLKNRLNDNSDSVTWKFARGEATTLADFGNPLADGTYRFCVYDDVGLGTKLWAAIPEGGTCGAKPCWKAKGNKGFSYTNGAATHDGIRSINLTAGVDGKAAITVKGRGANLRGPDLPFGQMPVRAQLIAGNDVCWETEFDEDDLDANTPHDFKAVGP